MTALGLIDDEGATWALMVPTMMHRIMALTPSARACHDLSRWAMVVHTAAPMAPWLKQAWIEWCGRDHIWEVYGATEGLVRCWIGGREWLWRIERESWREKWCQDGDVAVGPVTLKKNKKYHKLH